MHSSYTCYYLLHTHHRSSNDGVDDVDGSAWIRVMDATHDLSWEESCVAWQQQRRHICKGAHYKINAIFALISYKVDQFFLFWTQALLYICDFVSLFLLVPTNKEECRVREREREHQCVCIFLSAYSITQPRFAWRHPLFLLLLFIKHHGRRRRQTTRWKIDLGLATIVYIVCDSDATSAIHAPIVSSSSSSSSTTTSSSTSTTPTSNSLWRNVSWSSIAPTSQRGRWLWHSIHSWECKSIPTELESGASRGTLDVTWMLLMSRIDFYHHHYCDCVASWLPQNPSLKNVICLLHEGETEMWYAENSLLYTQYEWAWYQCVYIGGEEVNELSVHVSTRIPFSFLPFSLISFSFLLIEPWKEAGVPINITCQNRNWIGS